MSDFTIEVMNLIMSAKDPEAALAAALALVKEFVKAEGIVVETVGAERVNPYNMICALPICKC